MSTERMPDGTYVEIDDAAPQDVRAKIRAQHTPKSGGDVIPVAQSGMGSDGTIDIVGGQTIKAPDGVEHPYSNGNGNVTGWRKNGNSYEPVYDGAPLGEDKRTVQKQLGELKQGANDSLTRMLDSAVHEGSFHADDALAPALHAFGSGVMGIGSKDGFFGSMSRAWKNDRETMRQYRQWLEQEHGGENFVGGVLGALRNPIGAGEKVVQGIGSVAEKLAPSLVKAAQGSSALAKAGQFAGGAAGSPVGLAMRAGANQAGASALIDTGDVGEAATSGLYGAAAGGVLGGLVHGGGQLAHAIKDRAQAAASRTAYMKIADMLGRARRPGEADLRYSPEAAVREMNVAAARGGDPMLMDLSPEMRNSAGYLARKPNLDVANAMVDAGDSRIANAGARFTGKVEELVPTPTGNSAYAAKGRIDASRKAQGQIDYGPGGAMDAEIKWTPEIEKFFKDSPDGDRLLKKAYLAARRRGEKLDNKTEITVHGESKGVTGFLGKMLGIKPKDTVVEKSVPTMRVFDYLKRQFDGEIGKAIKQGNNTLAGDLSHHYRTLRQLVADANPDYAGILARQRDAFEQKASVEFGQSILSRMKTREGAQQLLEEMKSPKWKPDEFRTGFVDAMTDLHAKSDQPVALMRRFLRTPDQRAVLLQAFGGDTKKLNQFDKFMRRELRSMEADKMTATGRQSATDIFKQHGEAQGSEDIKGLISNVLRGQAFKGAIGALSGSIRSYDMLRRGMGPEAQQKMGEVLMGRGEGLVKGVAEARKFAKTRRVADRTRARRAGSVAGYATATPSDTE